MKENQKPELRSKQEHGKPGTRVRGRTPNIDKGVTGRERSTAKTHQLINNRNKARQGHIRTGTLQNNTGSKAYGNTQGESYQSKTEKWETSA